MKHTASFGLLVTLMSLLTACPSTQTPVTNVAGTWNGLISQPNNEDDQLPLTVVFEQASTALTGTVSLGPVPYQISGDLTGNVEGDSTTFSFSAVVAESSIDGEVTTTTATYTFTGESSGNTLGGEVVATFDDSDITIPAEFELERQ